MRAKDFLKVSSAVLSVVMLIGFVVYAQNSTRSHPDDDVYDGRIVQIKGNVTILNHPELGRTAGSGLYLVFQRERCRDCLIATHARLDGSYELSVGEGRYKLIVREVRCDYGGMGCVSYEMLAPDQPRYVEARRGLNPTQFDINVRVPRG